MYLTELVPSHTVRVSLMLILAPALTFPGVASVPLMAGDEQPPGRVAVHVFLC